MTTVEVLQRARQLYAANPSHAPLGEGNPPGTNCVVTAIRCAEPRGPYNDTETAVLRILAASARITNFEGDRTPIRQIVRWNADSSTDDVLAVFDQAIADGAAYDLADGWDEVQ